MSSISEKTIIRAKLEQYEGIVEHMYLDSEGFVTVGVGHLVKDLKAAQQLSFVRQKDGKQATSDEIQQDFDSVTKQVRGLFAGSYRRYTKLKLKKAYIDILTNNHIDSFERELKQIYGGPEFDSYPPGVRLALFDMIFNLGMTKLAAQFTNFNRHIKAKQWALAARECNRQKIGSARNAYVKGLLESAAAN